MPVTRSNMSDAVVQKVGLARGCDILGRAANCRTRFQAIEAAQLTIDNLLDALMQRILAAPRNYVLTLKTKDR